MDHYITAFGRINSTQASRNGKRFWSNQEGLKLADSLKAIYKILGMNYLKFFKMDEMSKLGVLGAEILLKDLNLTYQAHEIGILMLTSESSLFTDQKYFETISDSQNYFPSPSLFVYTLPNIVMGEIAIKNNLKGENICFVQDQFKSHLLFDYANYLLTRGSQKALLLAFIDVTKNDYECFMILIENNIKNNFGSFTSSRIEELYCNE
jgi:hypothetical protein